MLQITESGPQIDKTVIEL